MVDIVSDKQRRKVTKVALRSLLKQDYLVTSILFHFWILST